MASSPAWVANSNHLRLDAEIPGSAFGSLHCPDIHFFFFSGVNTEVALVQLPVGTGAEAFFTFLDPEVLPVPAALAARLTLSSFNTLSDLFNFLFLLL